MKHPVSRKLVTGGEAMPLPFQHRKPCCDCPWARTALPGWLGFAKGTTAQHVDYWLAEAHAETIEPCHCTTNRQCAGLAIFRANVLKEPRGALTLRLPPNTKLVFASDAEFRAHHLKQ